MYKLLGDHENIVKHYAGTFRGIEGRASIFMEKCGVYIHICVVHSNHPYH